MRGNRSFGRVPPRSRQTSLDDDGEPFEQDPPAAVTEVTWERSSARHARRGASPKPAMDVLSNVPDASGSVPDSFSRSSSDRRAVSPPATGKPTRSLRGRALGYLSRREHSRDELARKLLPFVEDSDGEDPIPALLDRLMAEGWLSDQRFADSVVNRRAARFGTSRIVGELKRHKVDGDVVQELGANLKASEWDRIQGVWSRKFGTLATTPAERAKQARFLFTRGFSRDAITKIIQAGDDEIRDDD